MFGSTVTTVFPLNNTATKALTGTSVFSANYSNAVLNHPRPFGQDSSHSVPYSLFAEQETTHRRGKQHACVYICSDTSKHMIMRMHICNCWVTALYQASKWHDHRSLCTHGNPLETKWCAFDGDWHITKTHTGLAKLAPSWLMKSRSYR